jgi:TetR/AcrR family transcriptional regulator, repressor for uid operon
MGPYVSTSPFSTRRGADDSRRERILKAAERAFVRHGFHAATMQHVAEEARMSAGNLYRYFPSKEAIVEQLCAFDQEEGAAAFAEIAAAGRGLFPAMAAGLRDHVVARPPEKARMIVEIWAEAGRNARVAALTRAIDADVLGKIEGLMEAAKAVGAAVPTLDSRFAARLLFTFVAGLFRRIATEPDFDRTAETAMAYGLLRAVLTGAVAPEKDVTR